MSDLIRTVGHRTYVYKDGDHLQEASIVNWGAAAIRQAAMREVAAAIVARAKELNALSVEAPSGEEEVGLRGGANALFSTARKIRSSLFAPAEPPDSSDPIVDDLPAWVHLIIAEREAQDAKWGANRDLDPFVWAAILTEEVGEVARCCLQSTTDEDRSLMDLPMELVQVAAVATQMLESMERRLCGSGEHTEDKET